MPFSYLSGSTYRMGMVGGDLTDTGIYDVNIGCKNRLGEEATDSGSFRVSVLSGEITNVEDSGGYGENGITYAGEVFDAFFLLKKDDVPLISGIEYDVTISDWLFDQ